MSRLSLALTLIICLALALFWIGVLNIKQPAAAADRKTTTQRAAEGAYVARTKALSATEDLSLVVIPSELGEPLDVKCFVYKNREFNHVTFICPDTRQEEISVPGPEH